MRSTPVLLCVVVAAATCSILHVSRVVNIAYYMSLEVYISNTKYYLQQQRVLLVAAIVAAA